MKQSDTVEAEFFREEVIHDRQFRDYVSAVEGDDGDGLNEGESDDDNDDDEDNDNEDGE